MVSKLHQRMWILWIKSKQVKNEDDLQDPWFWKLRKNDRTRRNERNFKGPRIIMSAEDEQDVMKRQKEYRDSKAQHSAPPPFYPGPQPPATPPPTQEADTEPELPDEENAEQA